MTTAPGTPVEPRFGLFLSQAGRTWAEMRDGFRMAEDLGFDHAFMPDHLLVTPDHPEIAFHEAWTLLAALAASTDRIRIGALVSSNTFRNPVLLLKEAITVDHISGGRLILGIGTGWNVPEHERYGITLPPAGERVAMLEEAVEILHRLMNETSVTFDGRYYQLRDATITPGPVQRPRIPVLIAGHRPRMIRLAARFADQWDTFPAMAGSATDGLQDELEARVRALDEACVSIGRDPAEIRRSTWTGGEVLGSEDAYVDFVERHRAMGFTDFLAEWPAPHHMDSLRRIASETIPALRRA